MRGKADVHSLKAWNVRFRPVADVPIYSANVRFGAVNRLTGFSSQLQKADIGDVGRQIDWKCDRKLSGSYWANRESQTRDRIGRLQILEW